MQVQVVEPAEAHRNKVSLQWLDGLYVVSTSMIWIASHDPPFMIRLLIPSLYPGNLSRRLYIHADILARTSCKCF